MPTKKINKFDVDETIAKQEDIDVLESSVSNLEKNFKYNRTHMKTYFSSGNVESKKITIQVPQATNSPFCGFIFTRYNKPISFIIQTGGDAIIADFQIETGTGIANVTKTGDLTIELNLEGAWSMFSLLYFTYDDCELSIVRG